MTESKEHEVASKRQTVEPGLNKIVFRKSKKDRVNYCSLSRHIKYIWNYEEIYGRVQYVAPKEQE